ncbi:uncharacterized protein BT62DRAFT_527647 [Guyanagaster necrorhizus]|uniref:Uncharacterized protein n=1 Tax=Guyanagaster necrorhizus TaxID=856835 RepID=A0A9P7W3J4_9AGAR|nr:uncharacterized protein BT62DRAFT_527647 [Guyanagaster necrorhizus MCA 3950]KAG7450641.1 hypothetical protein BT62DRAFT_527647 [Guyanagaster necrorhizus MCA 3950]
MSLARSVTGRLDGSKLTISWQRQHVTGKAMASCCPAIPPAIVYALLFYPLPSPFTMISHLVVWMLRYISYHCSSWKHFRLLEMDTLMDRIQRFCTPTVWLLQFGKLVH